LTLLATIGYRTAMSDTPPERVSIPMSLLTDAAMSKRSTLYRWMVANYDDFAEVLKQAGRPNWEKLALTLGEQGLRDAGDKPPTEECTRQTWWKVKKAMARRAGRPATQQKPSAAGSSSATAARPHQATARPDEEPAADDDRTQFDFDKARITKR
jgi:hypothetical protein